jgi:hypothetical protein
MLGDKVFSLLTSEKIEIVPCYFVVAQSQRTQTHDVLIVLHQCRSFSGGPF